MHPELLPLLSPGVTGTCIQTKTSKLLMLSCKLAALGRGPGAACRSRPAWTRAAPRVESEQELSDASSCCRRPPSTAQPGRWRSCYCKMPLYRTPCPGSRARCRLRLGPLALRRVEACARPSTAAPITHLVNRILEKANRYKLTRNTRIQ